MNKREEKAATLAIIKRIDAARDFEDVGEILRMTLDLIYVRGTVLKHDKELLDGVVDVMVRLGSALRETEAERDFLRAQVLSESSGRAH